MLSHLYQIASSFERRHGIAPNLLYLNYRHFEQLKQALPGLQPTEMLLQRLDMNIILQKDVIHPRVAWSPVRARAV